MERFWDPGVDERKRQNWRYANLIGIVTWGTLGLSMENNFKGGMGR